MKLCDKMNLSILGSVSLSQRRQQAALLTVFLESKLWFCLSIVHLCSMLHTKWTPNVSRFWPNDYLGIMFNLFPNPSKWLKICLHNSWQPSEKMKKKRRRPLKSKSCLSKSLPRRVFCCQICHLSQLARVHSFCKPTSEICAHCCFHWLWSCFSIYLSLNSTCPHILLFQWDA